MAGGAWPIPVAALGPVSVGSVLWRLEDQLMVTVVIKTAFALVAGAEMRLIEPPPLRQVDEHDVDPTIRSPIGSAELAPQLQRVDVVLTGHAYPPAHAAEVGVRLAVVSAERKLLDKKLVVLGDPDQAGA